MGVLNIYKGLSEEYKTIKGNASVKQLAHDLIPELDLSQCIIINAGEQITSDYVLTDNDIVFVRVIPGGIETVVLVCAAVGLVCSAVAVGAAVYSAVEQQKAQKEMEKAQKQAKALAEKITQLPFLKGANNRIALGYNIPFIMGSVYNVPYKLVSGYYTISGTNGANQFWNSTFICGYNNAIIQDVSVGTKFVKKSNATIEIPGQEEKVNYLLDSGATPYNFESDCPYYDPADKIDIKYSDEIAIAGLNEKISATSYSDELDYNNAIVKQLETNTYKIDVCIMFNGLRVYKDDGWKSKSVAVKIEWSADGSTWYDAGTISTGEKNERKTLRFEKTIEFTAAQCVDKDLSIRLTRLTALEESNSQETCYLCYINCWQYDATKSTVSKIEKCAPLENPWRERTSRLAVRVISNDSTKDNLEEINCNIYGKARIFDSGKWTSGKYPTRNPAAWVLEVMTTDVHPHSQYTDNEIDLESLGVVYNYCKENNFYCDGIITEDTKKSDVLNGILSECNTTMYLDDVTGKWTFAIEKEQSTPVALLNEQCIKNVTVTKSFERKPFAVKTTFTNRKSWAVDTFYQTKDGLISSAAAYGERKIILENAPKWITEFDHAYKYTRRQLAKQQLQPREIIVQVGHDGDYYPLYSKIILQMKQLQIGISNGIIHGVTVENGYLKRIVTSDLCDFFDDTKRYGIIIQAQNNTGKNLVYAEVKAVTQEQFELGDIDMGLLGADVLPLGFFAPGKTRILELVTPVAVTIAPEYGNIYSFGYLNSAGQFVKITNEMMIYNRKQNSDGWELLLKDYNDSIFGYGVIPAYKTNLTTPKESGVAIPEAILEKITKVANEVRIPGIDGKGIKSVTEYYLASASNSGVTTATTGFTTTIQTITSTKKYLWNYEVITYTDDTTTTTTPVIIGVYGDKGDSGISIFLDNPTATFVTDPEGISYSNEEAVTIHVVKDGVELPFTILSVGNNTSQISAIINYHTIAFQALEGNKLDDVSSIPIQIQYAEIAEEFPLGFDSSELGFDGKSIGYASDSPVKYNFTLYFTVTAKKVGIYQGVKTEIDSYLAASGKRYKGDWFIWGGSEDTSVTYTGVVYSFKVSCAYIWNGVSWAIDDNPEHNSEAFNDIIGVANDMLENNNATANLALNRLVSNTVFCKRLVAATAFIQNLFAQNVTVENQLTVNHLKATNVSFNKGTIKDVSIVKGQFTGSLQSQDVFLPCSEYGQYKIDNCTNFDINTNTMTVEQIKNKLDALIDHNSSAAVRIDFENENAKVVFIQVTSNDDVKPIPYARQAVQLVRYVDDNGYVNYRLKGEEDGYRDIIYRNTIRNFGYIYNNQVACSAQLHFGYIGKYYDVDAYELWAANIMGAKNGYRFGSSSYFAELRSHFYGYNNYHLYKYFKSKGISATPRMCSIKTNSDQWFIAVVYKENNDYIISYSNTKITVKNDGERTAIFKDIRF
ncbi:MAG: hypothetical protein PUJ82_13795 [Spirochaetales bacterium]|nr:hypothetical protein [Spirochaetales bacterium]MDY5914604.1 hypothetical protein [Treponema sp.]